MNIWNNRRKTKIIATIGPASCEESVLRQMIQAGANVIRLNFSHGSHKTHETIVHLVRKINKELGTSTCLLQDLQGPKIRLQEIENKQIFLTKGEKLVLTPEKVLGNVKKIGTNYAALAKDVRVSQSILINDGNIELKILEIIGKEVHTEVIHGGIVKSHNGLNLPETSTSIASLTEKDLSDLKCGLKNEVEWVALSFVRNPEDVTALKAIIQREHAKTKVIAKIEKPEALKVMDEIIQVSDGIMVARGDLGVEIPTELVPVVQKKIVQKCNTQGKPVIIATHMMESMVESSQPTRAEANDVANAVIDGADAVMLSAETAMGKYPVQAISTMQRILCTVEKEIPGIFEKTYTLATHSRRFASDSLIQSACKLRKTLEARAIISLTQSGYSGFRISSFRPETDIFIFTDCKHTVRALSLVWGVQAFYYSGKESTDQTIIDLSNILQKEQLVQKKDALIMLTSMPVHNRNVTNTVKVHIIN